MRYLRKTAFWPPCSIFSNGGHVFWRIKNPHSNFVHNTLRNNHAKFQNIWFSSFRGEDVWKSLRTTSDCNSSPTWKVRWANYRISAPEKNLPINIYLFSACSWCMVSPATSTWRTEIKAPSLGNCLYFFQCIVWSIFTNAVIPYKPPHL